MHLLPALKHRLFLPLGAALLAATSVTASAQVELLSIEFNENDQVGFDLWPGGISGSLLSHQFGGITVEVSTNTVFSSPTNRGNTMNGTPPGFSYQNLYEDLLHAASPTGTMTFDFSGLRPNELYTFTLFAWDPPQTSGTHEWTVTRGASPTPVQSVDWSLPLAGNDTFALVFDITTDAVGAFQIDNTDGLEMSAVNGFKLRGPAEGLGAVYCSPGVPNSSGAAGSMSATGSADVTDNNVVLLASSLARLSFGFFIVSETQGFVANPGGSTGNLCLGGSIGRYVGAGQIQNSGTAGEILLAVDLTGIPQPLGFVATVPGDTWNFQLWHRDSDMAGNPTSNFTDGLSIQFQ